MGALRAAEGAVPCRSGSNPHLTQSHLGDGRRQSLNTRLGPDVWLSGTFPTGPTLSSSSWSPPCCRGFGGASR